jgi:D-3-phosphoglycerate dehydrogenase
MYRIWVERSIPPAYLPLLENVAEVVACARGAEDAPMSALPLADAILAGSRVQYDGALMDQAPNLRVISRGGIGLDNVQIEAATARGVAVCNAPEAPTVSTAEHAMMLLLAVAKGLKSIERKLESRMDIDFYGEHTGVELRGRVLGLLGLGRIGSEVSKMASAFGMKVVAYDPFVSAEKAAGLGVEMVASMEAVFRRADFLSLHVPLTKETEHLVNTKTLQLMKPGAHLINCGRGGLVDENALLQALESGHLAGAGLDVFAVEPPSADHPLLKRDDVIGTPHLAAATDAAKDRGWRAAITQALQVLEGKRPPHLVNLEVWPHRRAKGEG